MRQGLEETAAPGPRILGCHGPQVTTCGNVACRLQTTPTTSQPEAPAAPSAPLHSPSGTRALDAPAHTNHNFGKEPNHGALDHFDQCHTLIIMVMVVVLLVPTAVFVHLSRRRLQPNK